MRVAKNTKLKKDLEDLKSKLDMICCIILHNNIMFLLLFKERIDGCAPYYFSKGIEWSILPLLML
jgi:hypothetical protein